MEVLVFSNGRSIKEKVIFLHGLLGDITNFSEALKFNKEDFEAHCPSFSFATLTEDEANVHSLLNILKEYIEKKHLNDFHLVGNSLGGHIAICYTYYYSEKVRSLVLAGSSGIYEKNFSFFYPKLYDRNFIKEKIGDIFYNKKKVTPQMVQKYYLLLNDKSIRKKLLLISRSAMKESVINLLPKIQVPCCLIWGKEDKVTPPDVALQFHNLLPKSRLIWFSKCGHVPMMEKPKLFYQTLKKWIVNEHKNFSAFQEINFEQI